MVIKISKLNHLPGSRRAAGKLLRAAGSCWELSGRCLGAAGNCWELLGATGATVIYGAIPERSAPPQLKPKTYLRFFVYLRFSPSPPDRSPQPHLGRPTSQIVPFLKYLDRPTSQIVPKLQDLGMPTSQIVCDAQGDRTGRKISEIGSVRDEN